MKLCLLFIFIFHCYGIIYYPTGNTELPLVSISYKFNSSTWSHICSGLILATRNEISYIGLAAHCISSEEKDFSKYQVMYSLQGETLQQHQHVFAHIEKIHFQRKWLNGTGAGDFAIIEVKHNENYVVYNVHYWFDNTTNMILIRKNATFPLYLSSIIDLLSFTWK